MEKVLTSIFSFILCHALYAQEIRSASQLKKRILKQAPTIELLRGFVRSGMPMRVMGMPSHEKARSYLIKKIKDFDGQHEKHLNLQKFKPAITEAVRLNQQDFEQKIAPLYSKKSQEYKSFYRKITRLNRSLKKFEKIEGVNIIWRKQGSSDEKKIVVTAHYDSLIIDPVNLRIMTKAPAPGADYNASGVAIALKLIELASKLDLKKTLEVVFLDYQGVGFLGSYQLAKELEKNKVKGVVNLEMLGHDSKVFDKKKKSGNFKAYARKGNLKDQNLFKMINYGKRVSSRAKFKFLANGFDRSDQFRFWEVGIPAITLSQDWENDFNEKRYQTSNDIVEGINVTSFQSASNYVLGGILGYSLGLKK